MAGPAYTHAVAECTVCKATCPDDADHDYFGFIDNHVDCQLDPPAA